MTDDALITEDWLRECGFKWEQLDRQPSKHWLLWIADACIDPVEKRMFSSPDDLGIELAYEARESWWFCWLRADFAGRYSRLLHVRHITKRAEVIEIVEALTGRSFVPSDSMYGSLRSPETAARMKLENDRLDQRIAQSQMDSVDRRRGNDPASRVMSD